MRTLEEIMKGDGGSKSSAEDNLAHLALSLSAFEEEFQECLERLQEIMRPRALTDDGGLRPEEALAEQTRRIGGIEEDFQNFLARICAMRDAAYSNAHEDALALARALGGGLSDLNDLQNSLAETKFRKSKPRSVDIEIAKREALKLLQDKRARVAEVAARGSLDERRALGREIFELQDALAAHGVST